MVCEYRPFQIHGRPTYMLQESEHTKLRGTSLLQRHIGGPSSSAASHDSGVRHNEWADNLVDKLAHLYATPEELRAIDDMSQLQSRRRSLTTEVASKVIDQASPSSAAETSEFVRGGRPAAGRHSFTNLTQARTQQHSVTSMNQQGEHRDAQIDNKRWRPSTAGVKSSYSASLHEKSAYNASVQELFRDLVGKMSKLESLAPTRLQKTSKPTSLQWQEGSLSSLRTDGAGDPISPLLHLVGTPMGSNVAPKTSLPIAATQANLLHSHGVKEMHWSETTPAMRHAAEEMAVPPSPPCGPPNRPRLNGRPVSSTIPTAPASSNLMRSEQSAHQLGVQSNRPAYHPRGVLATQRPAVWRRSAEKKRNKIALPDGSHAGDEHIFVASYSEHRGRRPSIAHLGYDETVCTARALCYGPQRH